MRLGLEPRGDLAGLHGPLGTPALPRPTEELVVFEPAPPLPGRGLAPPPRASALPPSPTVGPPIGRRAPARPSGGGAEGGAGLPGEGAQEASEEGDSGEGRRVGGGRAENLRTDRQTNRRPGMRAARL